MVKAGIYLKLILMKNFILTKVPSINFFLVWKLMTLSLSSYLEEITRNKAIMEI